MVLAGEALLARRHGCDVLVVGVLAGCKGSQKGEEGVLRTQRGGGAYQHCMLVHETSGYRDGRQARKDKSQNDENMRKRFQVAASRGQ